MRIPPTFPGERRADMVPDGLHVNPGVCGYPDEPGAPKFRDRSLPVGAWALCRSGRIVKSRGIGLVSHEDRLALSATRQAADAWEAAGHARAADALRENAEIWERSLSTPWGRS